MLLQPRVTWLILLNVGAVVFRDRPVQRASHKELRVGPAQLRFTEIPGSLTLTYDHESQPMACA